MTLRFRSRRLDVRVADAMLQAPAVRFWGGAPAVLHEGVACMATGRGTRRCEQVLDQVRATHVEHTGPGPGPLWLGGLSFDEDHEPRGAWRGFAAAQFALPRRQLVWQGEQVFETLLEGGEAPLAAGLGADQGAAAAAPSEGPPAPPVAAFGSPPWQDLVASAQRHIQQGDLTKVVVARPQRVPAVDVRRHVQALHARGDGTPFLFEDRGAAFYGATPETLVRLAGGHVTTHALAGSARGDAEGALLLASAKDVLEHELVAAFVRERLVEAGVRHVRQGTRALRRLRHVQHLETPVQGEAPPGAHLLELASALHPTPAVCGTPRRRSLDWIRRSEGWPRGWYAGAVGWFDAAGNGELSVALRCALQVDGVRHAFAGAGIVAGSEAGSEWAETEAKLATMTEVD